VSGSGISWAICKSAPCFRQPTTPVHHHSVFYRPNALPATQPAASKHWRQYSLNEIGIKLISTDRNPVKTKLVLEHFNCMSFYGGSHIITIMLCCCKCWFWWAVYNESRCVEFVQLADVQWKYPQCSSKVTRDAVKLTRPSRWGLGLCRVHVL